MTTLVEDGLPQLICTVVVVLVGGFDEREAVHVAHIGITSAAKHVEPTDALLEGRADSPGNFLFPASQVDRVPDFFLRVRVSMYNTIQGGALPSFCMCVVGPNRINFDVEAIRGQELFVQVGTLFSNS